MIKVAVIGSGNIGIDLVERLSRDPEFDICYLIGRRIDSPGLLRFKDTQIRTLATGIVGLQEIISELDGVFDATSAFDHQQHWSIIQKAGKWVIDLTPSKLGKPITPILSDRLAGMQINGDDPANYSMITCGGQSSALLLYAFSQACEQIIEVEISSSIAALSAGLATRRNIDQYIESTENLGSLITGCANVKAILVLNPAEPPVMMRTTVHLRANQINLSVISEILNEGVKDLQIFVPGYEVSVPPYLVESNLVTATVKVTGRGYYLPTYAGNLDIINAAAVETARIHMRRSGR